MHNPTYRFTHRPEGWTIDFTAGEYSVTVGNYATEAEAIDAFNQALGFDGMIRYRLDGGTLPG